MVSRAKRRLYVGLIGQNTMSEVQVATGTLSVFYTLHVEGMESNNIEKSECTTEKSKFYSSWSFCVHILKV